MTILLHDANGLMQEEYGILSTEEICNELVYADDTLLIGRSAQFLQKYMDCIAKIGRSYGLSLNWRKVEKMDVNVTEQPLYDDMGHQINVKTSLKYLGAQLAANGKLEGEVLTKDFEDLCPVDPPIQNG
eukprot:5653511-Karenia_brevis.AAC.1